MQIKKPEVAISRAWMEGDLDDRGREVLDPNPVSITARFIPESLESMMERFGKISNLRRQRMQQEFDEGEEDFDDHEIPPEGLSPYEVDAMPAKARPFWQKKPKSATPSAEEGGSVAESPNNGAQEAPGATSTD